MGMPGQSSRAEVQEVVRKFVRAVLDSGSVIGDTVTDGDSAIELYDQGYRMLDTSFDSLARGALSDLRNVAVEALASR